MLKRNSDESAEYGNQKSSDNPDSTSSYLTGLDNTPERSTTERGDNSFCDQPVSNVSGINPSSFDADETSAGVPKISEPTTSDTFSTDLDTDTDIYNDTLSENWETYLLDITCKQPTKQEQINREIAEIYDNPESTTSENNPGSLDLTLDQSIIQEKATRKSLWKEPESSSRLTRPADLECAFAESWKIQNNSVGDCESPGSSSSDSYHHHLDYILKLYKEKEEAQRISVCNRDSPEPSTSGTFLCSKPKQSASCADAYHKDFDFISVDSQNVSSSYSSRATSTTYSTEIDDDEEHLRKHLHNLQVSDFIGWKKEKKTTSSPYRELKDTDFIPVEGFETVCSTKTREEGQLKPETREGNQSNLQGREVVDLNCLEKGKRGKFSKKMMQSKGPKGPIGFSTYLGNGGLDSQNLMLSQSNGVGNSGTVEKPVRKSKRFEQNQDHDSSQAAEDMGLNYSKKGKRSSRTSEKSTISQKECSHCSLAETQNKTKSKVNEVATKAEKLKRKKQKLEEKNQDTKIGKKVRQYCPKPSTSFSTDINETDSQKVSKANKTDLAKTEKPKRKKQKLEEKNPEKAMALHKKVQQNCPKPSTSFDTDVRPKSSQKASSSNFQRPDVERDMKQETDKQNSSEEQDAVEVSDFIDQDYWTKEETCCGSIFRGVYGEVIVDARFLKPCSNRLKKTEQKEDQDSDKRD